jgi:DNA-binding beta-propeller fold protein YncE
LYLEPSIPAVVGINLVVSGSTNKVTTVLTSTNLVQPTAMAIDQSTGYLYIADGQHNMTRTQHTHT